MKKFKGGLYADLSNYNTSLPNTKILLNFFKSNPVGYRSGGVVRGIAGGNPTGMQVTGGFLANAQNFQSGSKDAVSSWYSPDRLRTSGKKILGGMFGVPVDPTYSWEGKEPPSGAVKRIPNIKPAPDRTINASGESILNPKYVEWMEQYGYEYNPDGTPKYNIGYDPQEEALRIGQDKYRPVTGEQLEEFEKQRKKSDTTTAYTGGEGSSRMGDDGITGLTQEEINKIKEKRKDTEIERELGQIKKPDSTKKDTKQSDTLNIIDDKIQENKNNKKNKNKKTTETNIVSVDGQPKNMFDMTQEDWLKSFTSLANKDEKQITSDDKSLSDRIAKALNPEAKDKGKEAPAWAMPLMMAGLQMAASNNPDMLGALGEGGIKGLEEYARIQKEKREDEKYEQEMALKKAGLIFDEERIKLSKDQLKLNQSQLEYNIASDAMKSYQDISLQWQQMKNNKEISDADLKLKYENLAATMDMEANRLAQDLLKFKADHELKLEGMSLDERKLELDWYKTETGNYLNSQLITSQVAKNNAQAEAAGFETGSVVDLEIGGKDMKVQIYRDKDGYHIQELGLATDKNSTKLLQAYMKSNPYWFEEYEEDPDAFFEKLEAVKDMSDILTDESKDINLDNIEKIQ